MKDLTQISDIELRDRREHPDWFVPMPPADEVERDEVHKAALAETARRQSLNPPGSRAKIHCMGDGNRGPRGGILYVFHCPGCKFNHPFEVNAPNGAGWSWNGSMDKPTFSPSLLVNQDRPQARCHSFVRDGQIQFLSDCFHDLKGQTVEIPDWDDPDDPIFEEWNG